MFVLENSFAPLPHIRYEDFYFLKKETFLFLPVCTLERFDPRVNGDVESEFSHLVWQVFVAVEASEVALSVP